MTDKSGRTSSTVSTTAKVGYTTKFVAIQAGYGNSTTYSASGSNVTFKISNTSSSSNSWGAEFQVTNVNLTNPTISFNYSLDNSSNKWGYGALYFSTNNASEILIVREDYTGSFSKTLSGTITTLKFGADAYNTYITNAKITNLKINGVAVDFG